MNPADIMKIGSELSLFRERHPKFAAFFQALLARGVEAGMVLEFTVTRPDGESQTTNMRIQEEDLEFLRLIRELSGNARPGF